MELISDGVRRFFLAFTLLSFLIFVLAQFLQFFLGRSMISHVLQTGSLCQCIAALESREGGTTAASVSFS